MKKKIANFFKQISIFEYILTIISLIIIVVFSFAFKVGILKILFSLFGVIMLLFVSKGWIIGEFFSLAYMTLYAIISYFSHYYGEMIISIFISLPSFCIYCFCISNILPANSFMLLLTFTGPSSLINLLISPKMYGTAYVDNLTSYVESNFLIHFINPIIAI